MSAASELPDRARYTVWVHGVLGPVFLASLPHQGVIHVESRSIVTMRVTGVDLVEIMQRAVDYGLEVESVREITAAASVPPGDG